jgi:hypothetical protein
MAPSQEEKSHSNGEQEITKSVNRGNLCLATVTRPLRLKRSIATVLA